MLTSSIIDFEGNSNYSLNVIILLEPIPCFHFINIILYILKTVIEKLQCQTMVSQGMVAINDPQIPIYMPFLDEL